MESEKLKKEQLHEYQRFASSFLLTHPVAILLLDIEQQRSRFCSVWQVIEEAELVDEYEAWKEANPNT